MDGLQMSVTVPISEIDLAGFPFNQLGDQLLGVFSWLCLPNTIIVCVRSNHLLPPLSLQMISWRGRLFQYSFTLRLAFCDLFSFTLLPMDAVLSLSRMPATFGLLLPPFEKVLWLRSYCRPQRFECIQFVFCGMVGTKGVGSQPFSTLR